MLTEQDFGLLVMQSEVVRTDVSQTLEWRYRLGFYLQADDFRVLAATGRQAGWAERDWLDAIVVELNRLRLAELRPAIEIPAWGQHIVVDGRFSPPLPSGPRKYVAVSLPWLRLLLGQYFTCVVNKHLQG